MRTSRPALPRPGSGPRRRQCSEIRGSNTTCGAIACPLNSAGRPADVSGREDLAPGTEPRTPATRANRPARSSYTPQAFISSSSESASSAADRLGPRPNASLASSWCARANTPPRSARRGSGARLLPPGVTQHEHYPKLASSAPAAGVHDPPHDTAETLERRVAEQIRPLGHPTRFSGSITDYWIWET
jgi:hypothetical protein